MAKMVSTSFQPRTRKKRPGQHAKKNSKSKGSKNYRKAYRGQGK